MVQIDVEKTLSELYLQEKVALTAGKRSNDLQKGNY
jgi:hypothetical protein